MLSPKCLWKTSASHDVPLNWSQQFQRIFLGMLELLGQSQGWEISSSPPGSAPRPKPSPVPKGANPHFSLKIIYYSKFSQASASLVLPGKPLRSQFTPVVIPTQRRCLHPLWELLVTGGWRSLELLQAGLGNQEPAAPYSQNSFFPSKAKRCQNLLVSLTQTLESKQRWKTPSTGIFFPLGIHSSEQNRGSK